MSQQRSNAQGGVYPWESQEDRTARVLTERARRLAVVEDEASSQAAEEFLLVRLVNERLALDTAHVVTVLRRPDICAIPCTPAWLLGVVSLRGRVLPVLDLGLHWGLRQQPRRDTPVVVLAHGSHDEALDMALGMAVDLVEGVRELAGEWIGPGVLSSRMSEMVRGVASGPVLVLDVGRILSDRALVLHEEFV